jgi:hypothetical protein
MHPAGNESGRVRPKPTTPRWVWWSALAIVGLYALFVLLLWRVGLLDFPTTGDGQAFAAVLGLLGGFFASSLTFIGLLIKHSIDERNARLAEEAELRRQTEADRTQQLAEEAENRLKLDSSIRAVDLLSTPDGKPAPPTEQAGALFALAHLGQLDLALTLLRELWPARMISTEAAVQLIDRGLNDSDLQEDAAQLFSENADLLPDKAGLLSLPGCLNGYTWPEDLPRAARASLLDALILAVSSRDTSTLDEDALNYLVLLLNVARTSEPDEWIRSTITFLLVTLIEARGYSPDLGLIAPTGLVSIDNLTNELQGTLPDAVESLTTTDAARLRSLRVKWGLPQISHLEEDQPDQSS